MMNDTLQTYIPYFDSVMQSRQMVSPILRSGALPAPVKVDAWAYQPIVGVVCLICLVLYIIAVVGTNGSLGRTVKELFSSRQHRYDAQPETQESAVGKGAYWVLALIGYTLFIILDMGSSEWTNFTIEWLDVLVFVCIMIGVMISLLLKKMIISVVGFVFNLKGIVVRQYTKFVFFLIAVMGQVGLIGCLGQIFLPTTCFEPIKWCLISLFTISFILSIKKAFQLFYIRLLSIYYLFLYFCAFNFIPLQVLKKACWVWLGFV